MECPHCKKNIELDVTGARPWWKNPGCLVLLAFAAIFVVWSIFFHQEQATKEDTAKLEQRLEAVERVVREVNQKLDKLPKDRDR
jgi:hypothetical protein